jgi:hypothetical protein
MSPEDHELEAEALRHNSRRQQIDIALKMLAEAQVHATLAVAGRIAAMTNSKENNEG